MNDDLPPLRPDLPSEQVQARASLAEAIRLLQGAQRAGLDGDLASAAAQVAAAHAQLTRGVAGFEAQDQVAPTP